MKTILGLMMVVAVAPVGAESPAKLTLAERAAATQANKFVARGNEFVAKDSPVRAKAEYLKALKEFPKHLDALYNIGVVCERLNQRDDAIGYYRQYLELKPDDPDVWTQLGVLYDTGEQKAEAQAAYEKALAANPKFGRAHHNLGVLLKEQGKLKQAGEHLAQYAALEEAAGRHNGEAYYSLGVYRLALGQAREAKLALQRAIEIDPQSAIFNNAMGDAYLLEKDPKVALVYFQKALDKDPKFALPYSGVGDAQKQLGDSAAAEKAYRRALELRPDYAVVHFKLGELFEATQPAAAIKHFENYLASGKNLALERAARDRLAVLRPVAEVQQIK